MQVASAALGGGSKGSSKPGEAGVKDLAQGHTSAEAAVAAINAAMRG